jgi:hypothetical protein
MVQSRKHSLHKTLAFAATLAVLGVSFGVPVEPAIAARRPAAREDAAPRTRPVELAFSLIEQPGQKQGFADGSKQGFGGGSGKNGRTASPAAKRGIGVIAPSTDGGKQGFGDGSHTGGTRGTVTLSHPQAPARNGSFTGPLKSGAQVPAVQ